MIPQPIDQVPLFQRLSDEERQLVIARLHRRQAAVGELIFAEGYPSDTLFVVNAGLVKLESGYKTTTLANLGAGSLLGEVDCLLGRPYSASAHAAANTQLLTLSRADIEDIISEHPSIGLKFGASLGIRIPFLQQYLIQHRLRNIELLSALAEEDLRVIAENLDFGSFERGDVIIDAGAPGEAAFFIEEGQVRLITESHEGTAFDDFKEGDIFGHTALITGKPYPSTARAITPVNLWILPRQVYQDLIQRRPAIKLAFSRTLAETLSANDQLGAVETMRRLHLFSDVPTEALSAIAARLVLRHFPAEEAIYTEGTPGDAMYIIEAGEVKLMDTAFSDANLLERARAGDSFGEMALLTGRTRAECARAATDATVWVLYKSDFDDVMVQYPEISLSLSRAITDRLASRENDFVIRHLRRIALFSDLTNSELNAIAKKVRGLRFRPGEIICFGGQLAHTLFMIERGEVKRIGIGPGGEPAMIDILDTGDSFGDQAIVQNAGYDYTAQALEDVEVWTISKADFLALMEQFPSLALTVTRLMADRLTQTHTPRNPPPPTRPMTRSTQSQPPRPPARQNAPAPGRRIQQPPSGARPIHKAQAMPQSPAMARVAPTPGVMSALSNAASQFAHPPLNQPRASALAPRPAKPNPARVSALATQPAKPNQPRASALAPRPPAPQVLPRAQHQPFQDVPPGGFLGEVATWSAGLSVGAKFRALVVGALVLWIVLIALPFTTITTVSSTVGGLQISNANGKPADPAQAKSRDADPFSSLKVAFAIPTNTPRPTETPKPTATPRPRPTAVPATRTPPTPVPPPVAAAPAAPPLPARYVDPRIGSGPQVLPHLDSVKVISANVQRGQKFWYAVSVKFENIDESGSDHTIYVKVVDENGKRVDGKKAHLTSMGGLSEYPEEKPASDMCDCNFNYPMYGDGYGFNIEDQYPSDQVVGMIMPMKRHVNFRVTFQLITNP